MASCKDCLHHKICEGFYEDEGTPLMASLCKEGDVCNQFEDKSKYICLRMDKRYYANIVKSVSEAMANLAKRLIPTKPKGDYHSVPHYRCPSCNCSVKLYENSEVYPYCLYCGQALDWNES